jgi:hypothetical protein
MGNYALKPEDLVSLKQAVEKFIVRSILTKFHLTLSPTDIESWICLANCYSAHAYDTLGAGVIEYRERAKVCEYQKVN